MTPRDRLLTTIRGGVADRVPLVLEKFHCGSPQEFTDPLRREIAERVYDRMHHSIVTPTGLNRYLVTDPRHITELSRERQGDTVRIISQINTPGGPLTAIVEENDATDTPWTVKYPVESLADIDKIRSCSWDVPAEAAPPDVSDPPEWFADRGITWVMISSPVVCVAGMMPREMFLELCLTHHRLLDELAAICTERTLATMDVALAEGNVDYVWIGGCEWLTPPMASPRSYEALVQPFETPIIDRAHAAGAIAHVHCHGNIRSTLEWVIQRGADMLEPCEPPPDGDVTFAEAKAVADGRITLGGNIEARVLECEDVDATERACRAAFEGGTRRMIFQTTAGPYHTMTPQIAANYHRLIDVWEELSGIE
ncbi:MAG: uroporphyrinogen decarboxylase family protein [Planctomycetota bacterium]